MKFPDKKTSALLVGFVLFLIVFAFALLTYTRRVEGDSMLPTLEQGDLVVIQNVPTRSIHVGDVIVYDGTCSARTDSNGNPVPVIHRVVSVTSSGFITKGDNNAYTDLSGGIAKSAITQDCIQGKVVFVVPYVELLASYDEQYPGLNYLLAALIVLAVVLYEMSGGERKDVQNSSTKGPP